MGKEIRNLRKTVKSKSKKSSSKMRTSSSSQSPILLQKNEYCGEKHLLQTLLSMDQIQNWKPLSCSLDNPQNCGPTALKFMFPKINDSEVQELSSRVEQSGITLNQFNEFMYSQLQHLDVTISQIYLVFFNILDFFRKNLFLGCITVVGLSGSRGSHMTTIARDLNNNIIMFDGQRNIGYTNNEIIDYIVHGSYTNMYIWCSKHKYKRPRSTTSSSRKSIKKTRM